MSDTIIYVVLLVASLVFTRLSHEELERGCWAILAVFLFWSLVSAWSGVLNAKLAPRPSARWNIVKR